MVLPMVDSVYEAVAMMANVTTHKMTKLDKLCVLASEWSAQIRPDTSAIGSRKKMTFGVFMAQRCLAGREKIVSSIAPAPA
jgi:hypothetical protein